MAIYSLSGGIKRIDVSQDDERNNLKPGTVIRLNGYSSPDAVIIRNEGINDRFTECGARYLTVYLDGHKQQIINAVSLKWLSEKKDNRIQWYITDETLSESEVKKFFEASEAVRLEEERKKKEAQEKHEADLKRGLEMFEKAKPSNAVAVIIAEKEIDDCDLMTDYFNVKTEPFFVIAYSNHKKNLFHEMRKAAVSSGMPELAHFAENRKEDEQRENYSGGGGYYLKRGGHYSTGWAVRKRELSGYYIDKVALAYAQNRVSIGQAKTGKHAQKES